MIQGNQAGFFTVGGNYTFPDDKHMVITPVGIASYTGPQEYELISFSGDEMVFKDSGGNELTYTRRT